MSCARTTAGRQVDETAGQYPHRLRRRVRQPAVVDDVRRALAAYEQGREFVNSDGVSFRLDGIGFMLGDGWAGVDCDKCRDQQTGQISDRALAVVRRLNTYTEISPSRTGLKSLVRGELPPGRRRNDWIEMYDKVRYFTVTGSRLPLTPATVEDRTAELAAVHADVFPPEPKQQIKYTPPLSLSLADAEIIAKAKAARNGAAFAELFEGGTGKHGSDSEADLALASHIAFYAGPDPLRIESVMKLSGRAREKWTTHKTYLSAHHRQGAGRQGGVLRAAPQRPFDRAGPRRSA